MYQKERCPLLSEETTKVKEVNFLPFQEPNEVMCSTLTDEVQVVRQTKQVRYE